MDFITYLQRKKIDSDAFRKADPHQWAAWKKIFNQIHPKSFTAQKLYLINPLRHIFPYEDDAQPQVKKEVAKKPVIKPKPHVPKSVEETKSKAKVKPKIQGKPKIGDSKTADKSAENKGAPAGMDKPGVAKPAKQADKPAKKPRPVIKRPKKD